MLSTTNPTAATRNFFIASLQLIFASLIPKRFQFGRDHRDGPIDGSNIPPAAVKFVYEVAQTRPNRSRKKLMSGLASSCVPVSPTQTCNWRSCGHQGVPLRAD